MMPLIMKTNKASTLTISTIDTPTLGAFQQWSEYTPVPFPSFKFSGLIAINDDEFVAIQNSPADYKSYQQNKDRIGIWKYNIMSNEWELLAVYPMNQSINNHSVAYSKRKQVIIIHTSSSHVIIYNLNANLFQIKSPKKRILQWGESSDLSLIIDNKLNVFCRSGHFIWNGKKRLFILKHGEDIWDELEIDDTFRFHAAVYVQSMEMILLFGGNTNEEMLDYIFKYDLIENKWELLEIRLPALMTDFAYLLTTDERYIIIFDGRNDGAIWIWEIMSMSFNRSIMSMSEISGVQWNKCEAVMMRYWMGDDDGFVDLLVTGCVKEWMEEKYLRDLVIVIKEMYFDEYVHVLGSSYATYINEPDPCHHFGVKLRDLLQDDAELEIRN